MIRALDLINSCNCTEKVEGCPGCVQFTHCTEYNSVLHKESAALILKLAIEYESDDEDVLEVL